MQTRVALWFGAPPKLGRQEIVSVDVAEDAATVRLQSSEGQPGYTSFLRVAAAEGAVTLEVMEQAKAKERRFTRSALAQVSAELSRAVTEREALLRDGYVASLWPGGELVRGPVRMTVADGMQPGIYVVTAWVNPGEDGVTFVRVRQSGAMPSLGAAVTEVKAGAVLSEERMRGRSARRIGFAEGEADVLFPYQSEVTVYEGDWGEDYGATFEVVFAPEGGGSERVLVSEERVINGWMR